MSRRTLIVIAGLLLLLAGGFAAIVLHFTRAPTADEDVAWTPMASFNSPKRAQIDAILETAATSRPAPAEAEFALDTADREELWEIRIRAMAVLPHLAERERAIDVLIAALRERDLATNGGGNVPLSAATYLAEMNATRAIPALVDWVDYLKTKPLDPKIQAMVEKKCTDDLERLKAVAAMQPGT